MGTAFLTLTAVLLSATAVAAQMKWFTPNAFNVTCQITQQCTVNEACKSVSNTLAIEHNSAAGLTRFVLPDGTQTEGVLGVMSIGETQTLAATTSANAEKMYRINIFPDASVSVGVVNYIDRPEDMLLYGTCLPPES